MWYKFAIKKLSETVGGGVINRDVNKNVHIPVVSKPSVMTETLWTDTPPNALEVLDSFREDPDRKNPEDMSLSQQIEELNHQKRNVIDSESMGSLEGAQGESVIRGIPQYEAYNASQGYNY